MSRLFDVPMPRWVPLSLGLLLLAGCSTGADQAAVCANIWCPIGVCHANGDQPECRCTTWDRAAGAPCDRLETRVVDAGSGLAGGQTVQLILPLQSGTISKYRMATEADRFDFTAVAGDDYLFEVTPSTVGVVLTVELRDAAGQLVSSTTTDGSAPAQLIFHVEDAVVRSVQVRRAAGFEASVVKFDWRFQETNPLDQGPDPANAGTIAVGTTHDHFDFRGDVDAFRFEGAAGVIYRLSLASSAAPATLALVDGAGGTLAQSSYLSFDGLGAQGFLIRAPQDWTAYLVLRDQSTSDAVRGVPYTLQIAQLPPDQVADTPAQATAIAFGTTISGKLNTLDDVDVYAFPMVASRIYLVTEASAAYPVAAGVLAGDGGVVAALAAPADGIGNVVVRAGVSSGLPGTPIGDFSFKLLELPPDESSDAPDASVPIAVESSVTGYCVPEGDVDTYRVALGAGQFAVISVDCASSWCPWDVSNPGLALGVQVGGKDVRVVKSVTSGEATISVFYGMPYRITVADGGIDDHGGDPEHATPLAVGEVGSGSLQWGFDSDYFAIPLQGGTRYELHSSGPPATISVDGLNISANQPFTPSDAGTYYAAAYGGIFNVGDAPYTLSVSPAP